MITNRHRSIALITGAILCSGAILFGLFWSQGFDDPYITYRYAANLARGDGFVYNLGERVLSTTAPFYTIILAGFYLLGLSLPLASNALSCLSLAFGGWALWQLHKLWGTAAGGPLAALVYATFPLLIMTLGGEAAFYIAAILAGFVAYATKRYSWTAAALAVATLTRADGVLVPLILASHWLLFRRDHLPWRALIIFCLPVGIWFTWAWLYFGSPFPVTLVAKQQQALMVGTQSFFRGFLPFLAGYWRHPLYQLSFVLAGLGLIYALIRRSQALLIVVWCIAYFGAYSLLHVPRYYWYYTPLLAGFAVLVGLGFTFVSHGLARLGSRKLQIGGSILLACLILYPQARLLATIQGTNDNRLQIYHTVGLWLHDNTPPDATIGTLEVGIIGYYADRRMIDFAGLIQPATGLQLGPSTGYEDAARWAIAHYHPSVLVLRAGEFPSIEQDQQLMSRCRNVQTFSDPRFPRQVVIYRCA